jgi:TP901 family phage tail tape measure protein
MLNGMGLGMVLSARDLASAPLARVHRAFGSLDERIGVGAHRISHALDGMGGRVSGFARSVLGTLGALAVTKMSGDFEKHMAALGGKANATGERFERLEKAALAAGLATQYSPTDAVKVLTEFAAASYSTEQSIRMLLPALDLAAGSFGKLSPEEAVGTARQAMSAFSIEVDQASVTMDKLLRAANSLPFDPDDLPLALSIAPRGAQAIKQSLEETLIATGFAKALITRTERAATAVAVAMERMAQPKVQQKLAGIGVVVTDNEGRFRDFLDVVIDMIPALGKMTDKARAAFLVDLVGTEGLAGVQAMMRGIERGIETASGEMLRGADAVNYLRRELRNAEGAGARFRTLMLDTYVGHKQLLKGSLQTLAIVVGRSLTAVINPILALLKNLVNALIGAIESIPAPLRRVLAGVGLAVAIVAALASGLLALRAALGFVAFGLHALRAALRTIAMSLGPIVLVLAAVVAALSAFAVAYRRNLGGFADWARSVHRRVQLAWDALVQLVSSGAFSGAVLSELSKAEHHGVKRFAIALYMAHFRLKRLWQGLRDGFLGALHHFRGVFTELGAAFADLGHQLAGLVGDLTGSANQLPSSQFVSFGQIVGAVLGSAIALLATLVAWVSRLVAGFLEGFRTMDELFGPALRSVRDAIADLVGAFQTLLGIESDTTLATSEVGEAFRVIGYVLGKIVGAAVTTVAYAFTGLLKIVEYLVRAVTWLKDAFLWFVDVVQQATNAVIDLFGETIPNTVGAGLGKIAGFFQAIRDFVQGMIDAIRAAIDTLVGWIKDLYETVAKFLGKIYDGVSSAAKKAASSVGDLFKPSPVFEAIKQGKRPSVAPDGSLAVAEVEARSQAVAAAIGAPERAGLAVRPPWPIHVAVQVDGETIARAAATAHEDAARRTFLPVPSY